MKRSQLKRKGGRLFPQSPEDKAYWDWFKKQRYPCDVCGWAWASAAHLTKRSRGGCDRGGLVYLCEGHDIKKNDDSWIWRRGCHSKQEGRTDAFILETKVNLWEIAKRHTRQFDNEGETDRRCLLTSYKPYRITRGW